MGLLFLPVAQLRLQHLTTFLHSHHDYHQWCIAIYHYYIYTYTHTPQQIYIFTRPPSSVPWQHHELPLVRNTRPMSTSPTYTSRLYFLILGPIYYYHHSTKRPILFEISSLWLLLHLPSALPNSIDCYQEPTHIMVFWPRDLWILLLKPSYLGHSFSTFPTNYFIIRDLDILNNSLWW